MKDPKLVVPDVKYEKSYIEAFHEPGIGRGDTQLMMPAQGKSFEDFVKELIENSKGINVGKGRVPSSTFWLIDGDEFIGRLSIRHKLTTEKLKMHVGHIGYLIRPSKRRMGYGKKILELGLQEAKKLGITKNLITCDVDNIPSRKIIESHGGKLENKVLGEPGKPDKYRFWIDIG